MSGIRNVVSSVLVFAVLLAAGAGANVKQDTGDLAAFRSQLLEFFKNAGKTSPTVMGPALRNPELLQQVQERIASMDDQELAVLREKFGQIPNWQAAPELLAASLPDGTVNKVDAAGREMLPTAEQGMAFRGDVRLLAALAGMLPPEEAAKLGIDRDAVHQVQVGFGTMDPMQAAAIAQGVQAQVATSNIGGGLSFDGLDPTLAEGARALAEHGPLSDQDLKELEGFRADVLAVTSAAAAFRRQAGDDAGAAEAQATADRVRSATPEMLFVMGRQIDPVELAAVRRQAETVRRMTSLSDEDLAGLEGFRTELLDLLAASGGAGAGDLATKIAVLPTEQLLPVREQMQSLGNWQKTLPLAADVAHSQRLQTEIAWLEQPQPPADLVADLELYRGALQGQLQALSTQPGADVGQLEAFGEAIQSASVKQLAVLRLADEEVGGIRSAGDVTRIASVAAAAVDLNCVVGLGSIHIPVIDKNISLGSINLNWICTPLENAINSVTNTVNTIVDGIKTTVNDVWTSIQAFPTTIKNALTDLFNLLLDVKINGYSLRDLTDPATLQQALGLASDYWNAIPNLPDVPCPPAGTNIPGFGKVGDGDAAARLERYLWISDQLLGLMPDTEVSLAVKLPAQLLYGGVQYLSVCLNEAAANAEGAETAAYRESVTTGLAASNGNQAALMTQLRGVESQVLTARDLDVRLQIERNLKARFDEPVAIFQIPASQGGYLDYALDIVQDAAERMQAAGEGIGNAMRYLHDYKVDIDGGRFKKAYRDLQRAYREIIFAGPATR